MKDLVFDKQCNIEVLTTELKNAGFKISGCSGRGKLTVIHLYDDETKNPTRIVDAHIYTAPKTPEEMRAELKQRWASANTTDQKLNIIAAILGLQ
jgi:hypothetical protein